MLALMSFRLGLLRRRLVAVCFSRFWSPHFQQFIMYELQSPQVSPASCTFWHSHAQPRVGTHRQRFRFCILGMISSQDWQFRRGGSLQLAQIESASLSTPHLQSISCRRERIASQLHSCRLRALGLPHGQGNALTPHGPQSSLTNLIFPHMHSISIWLDSQSQCVPGRVAMLSKGRPGSFVVIQGGVRSGRQAAHKLGLEFALAEVF
jgi:hypothetical protein